MSERHPPFEIGAALILAAVTLLLAGGAVQAGLDVDVMYDHKADFSAYTTYRWKTAPQDDSPEAAMVDGRIKTTADRELAAKGLRRAAPDESCDLLLTYYGGIEDNLLIEGVRYEVAPHVVWTGASPMAVTRSYQVGTLILDFVDAETEIVVWSGVVAGKAKTGSELRQRVEKAVKKMLRQYPPR